MSSFVPSHSAAGDGLVEREAVSGEIILAGSDQDLVNSWLDEYRDSPDTYRTYQRESDRFLAWADKVLNKRIASISKDDVVSYEDFLRNPPTQMLGPARPRTHPLWKPMVKPLTNKGVKFTYGVLHSMFEYLSAAGSVPHNPIALIRSRRRKVRNAQNSTRKALSMEAWQFLLAYIMAMPQDSIRAKAHYHRCRWLIQFLYITGFRRFESAIASTIELRAAGDRWWLGIQGKGRQEGELDEQPIPEELITEYKLYRSSLSMSPLPGPGESLPLLLTLGGKAGKHGKGLSREAVYKIVRHTFQGAAQEAAKQGRDGIAAELAKASTHTLRHTHVTHFLAAGGNQQVAMINARHKDLNTTLGYSDVERNKQHDEVTDKLAGNLIQRT